MLLRKLLRTAWSYKAQFISMIIMMTLGIGIFLGFNMEWKTIEYDVGNFFEDTNYADYRLYSETGFTKDELNKIVSINGVDAATRYLSVNLEIKGDSKKALALGVSENYTVSTFTLMSGAEYDEASDGILEKLPSFGKVGFATKWNLRDLMRHKSRFAMTLVGIIGCMVLLVGGLGMRDTMSGFLDLFDNGISHYTTKVNLVENTDYERAKELIADLDADWESYSGISIDGYTATLDIVHNEKGRFDVIDENNKPSLQRSSGLRARAKVLLRG